MRLKHLMGGGAAALMLAAGAARAADIPPIVIPAAPTVVSAPASTFNFRVETGFQFVVGRAGATRPVEIYGYGSWETEWRSARGWGLDLSGSGRMPIPSNTFGVPVTVDGRIYRAVGPVSLGLAFGTDFSLPNPTFDFYVAPSVELAAGPVTFDTQWRFNFDGTAYTNSQLLSNLAYAPGDRLGVLVRNDIRFGGGSFSILRTHIDAAVSVADRLQLEGGVLYSTNGSVHAALLVAMASYDLGWLQPYAGGSFALGAFTDAPRGVVGARMDVPLGTGTVRLVGDVNYAFNLYGGVLSGSIGLSLSRGIDEERFLIPNFHVGF